jgi:hypothetical protein
MPKDSWKSTNQAKVMRRAGVNRFGEPLHGVSGGKKPKGKYVEIEGKLTFVPHQRKEKTVKNKGWYGELWQSKEVKSQATPLPVSGSNLHCDEMWVGCIPYGIKGVVVITNRAGMAMLGTMSIEGIPVKLGPTPDHEGQAVFKVMS